MSIFGTLRRRWKGAIAASDARTALDETAQRRANRAPTKPKSVTSPRVAPIRKKDIDLGGISVPSVTGGKSYTVTPGAKRGRKKGGRKRGRCVC